MKAFAAGVLLALAALPAAADKNRLPPHPEYRAECGSCHVAFPPRLLPAESWRQLMAGLDRHFGTDASLDARLHEEIGRYLAAHAGRRAPPPGAAPRITETRWFVKEHDEISAARWKSPAVKTPANCSACHKRAEEGIYEH